MGVILKIIVLIIIIMIGLIILKKHFIHKTFVHKLSIPSLRNWVYFGWVYFQQSTLVFNKIKMINTHLVCKDVVFIIRLFLLLLLLFYFYSKIQKRRGINLKWYSFHYRKKNKKKNLLLPNVYINPPIKIFSRSR